MWCVSLCVVCCCVLSVCVVCGCGCSCVDVGCVRGRGGACGVARWKTPYVHTKRLREYVQNVPVCTGTTRTCVSTCARGAGTHGDVLNVHTEAFWVDTRSHRQFCLPRIAHVQFSLAPERFTKRNERILPIFLSLGGVCREQHVRDSSNHSLNPDEAVQLKLSWGKLRREPAVRWLDLSIAPAGIKQHERTWREGEDAISQKRPLTFHNVSSFFCFSLQFQALFHMLTLLNMWNSAWNCSEKQKKNDTLWKVNGTTTTTCKKKWKSCTCAHKPHNIHHTDRTLLSCLVSSLFSSLLFSYISISSAILLKLTFANMSVGKARPCEQDTRMPINITAQKNFITLLSVCFLLSDVVACSLLVGCWLYVCCMFAVTLGWLVGCHSRTRRRTVSCVFTFTKHHAGQHTKKTTSTGESCEQVQWQTLTKKKRRTCLARLTNWDHKIAKIKLIIFGY